MSVLMRASELIGRPVVSLAGKDIAQVKDLVYDRAKGDIEGFTLNGRGLLAGPLHEALPWESVLGCGPDAVIVRDETVLSPRETVVSRAELGEADVLGSRVITESGRDVGEVVDVVVRVALVAHVVGYEIESSPALSNDVGRVLIPLPDTLAVSGEALMVPDAAVEFVSNDLSGFGAAVETFRARLRAGT